MEGELIDPVSFNQLKEAVDYDINGNLDMAVEYYLKGIDSLIKAADASQNAAFKKILKQRISMYLTRAKKLKDMQESKKNSKHEHIQILADGVGFSYDVIFGKYLNDNVTSVIIYDPYIRSFHQIQNLVRFIELLIKQSKCNYIKLVTTLHQEEKTSAAQKINLDLVADNCWRQYNIKLELEFSTTLHDRSISLNTGVTIKIGRGLDYFKPLKNNLCPGVYDLQLRKCHETWVDIFWH